jgi:hypothetical protein
MPFTLPPSPPRSSRLLSSCRRTARAAMAVVPVVGLAVGAGFASAPVASATARLAVVGAAPASPETNPPTSFHPSQAFKRDCFEANHTASCNRAALADIDRARAREKLKKIHIPKGFYSMSAESQLAVVADRERNARGLPSMATSAALDAAAQLGAEQGNDPTGPSAYSWGSNISWGYVTPLAADFGWMYDDGTDSPNIDCQSAGAPGCWGHRDNILARWRGKQGDGAYNNHGTTQLTELFVENY